MDNNIGEKAEKLLGLPKETGKDNASGFVVTDGHMYWVRVDKIRKAPTFTRATNE